MSERKLFEAWLKSIHYEYEVVWRSEYNCYNSRPLNDMFKSWKASVNRKGYKLVPVEMSWNKADDLAVDEWNDIKELFKSQNKDLTAIQIQDFRLRWCRHKAEQIKSEYEAVIRVME